MHFTTLFVLKNETLENISRSEIEDMFAERFCYCCGETKPKYHYYCDWFQLGGRWSDILKAKKGIRCEKCWSNDYAKDEKDMFSIVEIKDLIDELPKDRIYAVATKSRIYEHSDGFYFINPEKFDKFINDINNKKFNGVIALIDCHD